MSKLKEWWAVIVMVTVSVMATYYMFQPDESFKIHVRGGLFGPVYDVDIPAQYMTQELAEKHNEAFLSAIDDLVRDL